MRIVSRRAWFLAVAVGAHALCSTAVAAPARAPVAPSNPPLTTGGTGGAGVEGTEAGEGSPQAEADPLVSNGLGSPLCKGVLGARELPATGRRNCETSGFIAAAAPTGDYGIDVHIDTGVLGVSTSSAVQDLVVMPLWMAIVWVVHAVVVMLEWCFTIDVLASTTASVGRGLRQAQSTLTQPWLVVVLAVASVLALYNGLVRRRVAETLGQATLMGAMMAGGLLVMADPTGTVDALGAWANQASLGTLAVAASGTPANAGGALARSMDTVFAAAVEAPWCYLEFGDVDWCRNPIRLDARLRAAGVKIAAGELATIGCALDVNDMLGHCVARGSAQAHALEHSAALLGEARSNGAIFLALPASGPSRNAINDQGSLLRALCQSNQMSNCRGPTVAQAEFRTGSGTLARLGGLLLIAIGVLGMTLLLGFIAVRLLTAAVFSLLYLLLAPGVVLAPALGDGGRTVFRRWAAQLLGALVSKLLFSFLLGVVLAVLEILSALQTLGWWTQWLLMSAFWWGAFIRRNQALGLVEGTLSGRRSAGDSGGGRRAGDAARRSLARGVGGALDSPRRAIGAARWTLNRLGAQGSNPQRHQARSQAADKRARAGVDGQVRRMLELEHDHARRRTSASLGSQRTLSDRHAQLRRVQGARTRALADGDGRRAARLGDRGRRIEDEIQRERAYSNESRRVAEEAERAMRRTGAPYTREQLDERARFLDEQASRAPAREGGRASRAGRSARPRDYAALAALAGYGREQFERLEARDQRSARLEIDRELALRKELSETARRIAQDGAAPKLARGERRNVDRAFDAELEQRLREDGRALGRSRRERTAPARWQGTGGASETSNAAGSSVMRDAREVAARRKRQLGGERR